MLHAIVREHLEPFLQYARETYARPIPKYVEQELRGYLKCGRKSEKQVEERDPRDEPTNEKGNAPSGTPLCRVESAEPKKQAPDRGSEAVEDTAALAVPLLSLGLVQPGVSTRPSRGSYERPPTHAEYLAASPRTEILYQNLVADEGCGGPGTLCHDLAAVERPADESAPMALRFVVLYRAMGAEGRHDRCELREEFDVELPSGGSFEARIRELFGDRVVRLSDLAGAERVR